MRHAIINVILVEGSVFYVATNFLFFATADSAVGLIRSYSETEQRPMEIVPQVAKNEPGMHTQGNMAPDGKLERGGRDQWNSHSNMHKRAEGERKYQRACPSKVDRCRAKKDR